MLNVIFLIHCIVTITVYIWKCILNNTKSKIKAVPTAFSFGGTIFGGSMSNSASTRKCCLLGFNFFRFLSPLGWNVI